MGISLSQPSLRRVADTSECWSVVYNARPGVHVIRGIQFVTINWRLYRGHFFAAAPADYLGGKAPCLSLPFTTTTMNHN